MISAHKLLKRAFKCTSSQNKNEKEMKPISRLRYLLDCHLGSLHCSRVLAEEPEAGVASIAHGRIMMQVTLAPAPATCHLAVHFLGVLKK